MLLWDTIKKSLYDSLPGTDDYVKQTEKDICATGEGKNICKCSPTRLYPLFPDWILHNLVFVIVFIPFGLYFIWSWIHVFIIPDKFGGEDEQKGDEKEEKEEEEEEKEEEEEESGENPEENVEGDGGEVSETAGAADAAELGEGAEMVAVGGMRGGAEDDYMAKAFKELDKTIKENNVSESIDALSESINSQGIGKSLNRLNKNLAELKKTITESGIESEPKTSRINPFDSNSSGLAQFTSVLATNSYSSIKDFFSTTFDNLSPATST